LDNSAKNDEGIAAPTIDLAASDMWILFLKVNNLEIKWFFKETKPHRHSEGSTLVSSVDCTGLATSSAAIRLHAGMRGVYF
jgi:hypothetical protein